MEVYNRMKVKGISHLCILIMVFCGTITVSAKKKYQPEWESLKQHQTPEWFLDAKFGIYFHWGVYSYMGKGEWYSHHMYEDKAAGWNHDLREHHLATYGDTTQYYDFFPKFTAEHFDANDWAQLFKDAGVKFAGPVAEHCDYFSNWDSKVNKYNSVNYGPHRDLVGELEKAIKAKDMKFVTTFHHSWEWGWYMLWNGLADTTNAEFRALFGEVTPKETFYRLGQDDSGKSDGKTINPKDEPSRKFVDLWKAKIFEVVDRYKPDLLWFDSRLFLIPEKDRKEMVAHFYNKGIEWGKDVTLTYKNEDLATGAGVLDLERGRMDEKTDYPWLTDDSYPWNGWSWRADLKNKQPNDIVDELIDIVSKNGALLLGITPTADGLIPEEQRNGLLEVGKWLKLNGEAIYKTRPFITYGEGVTKLAANHFGGVQAHGIKFTNLDFRFTSNGKYLYIMQLEIPEAGKEYLLKSFAKGGLASHTEIKKIEVIGSNEKINWVKSDEGLRITAPKVVPIDKAIVYKVKL